MKPPIFVRTLTSAERQQLQAGLRSVAAFTVRRCQILLASANGLRPPQIARQLACAVRTVHYALHAFDREGLACLQEKSSRPHSARPFLDARYTDALKDLLHQSPRLFGKPTSLWTLPLVAEVCHGKGWTPRQLSGEAIRVALKRLGIRWRRAKHWITSPDPAYVRKKHARDRLIRLAQAHPDWVLGFQDETWWSRLALPSLHAWAEVEPLRLVERSTDGTDPDPKALCCYGLLRDDTGQMLLRFVQGRPVSQVTEDYLDWVCQRLAAEGKTALLLVWDNASWHISRRVRAWIKAHNRRVKQEGGVRIVACRLPSKSPWLNPIEPKWAHGKKAIVEPERLLTGQEVKDRVCHYYDCEQVEPLEQKVA
ncbi:MAG TPA: IS630 family transposase [Gemmataceae bacterium]|jgi:transposase/DNA-binding CsgD family transcriptional regulator|nr:IS630 family transposase [Gemmataceae bacterium]